MTGMTGRRRAAPSPAEGESRPLSDGALDELPSGSAVGDLIESDRGAHRISKSEGSSLSAYLQALRKHPLLSREEEHELAVRYVADARAVATRASSSRRTCAWS